ncbi:MAG: PilZ domain-containing protein [Deltaproteobacteria bacterium]|nr:PilZ domain-containing protein [Deltaproteobacteria bacterium]
MRVPAGVSSKKHDCPNHSSRGADGDAALAIHTPTPTIAATRVVTRATLDTRRQYIACEPSQLGARWPVGLAHPENALHFYTGMSYTQRRRAERMVQSILNSGVEKRRTARRRVTLSARYQSGNVSLEGAVIDLSPDGLFFMSEFLDDIGESARIWVEIPNREAPLELRGEVRWINDNPNSGGMGVRLFDLSMEDRAVLSNLPTLLWGLTPGASIGNA